MGYDGVLGSRRGTGQNFQLNVISLTPEYGWEGDAGKGTSVCRRPEDQDQQKNFLWEEKKHWSGHPPFRRLQRSRNFALGFRDVSSRRLRELPGVARLGRSRRRYWSWRGGPSRVTCFGRTEPLGGEGGVRAVPPLPYLLQGSKSSARRRKVFWARWTSSILSRSWRCPMTELHNSSAFRRVLRIWA